ncbi:alpha-beta hydrolase superfamily lysophospholipase [Natronobacillus azotifigens]|uniref:Alpha/beta hydrolase n=1 Tax=Natronobacillus azotifigens TaxID=472978 RepID=A0A9J6RCS3_9BACI|nr:alpha/beta hydrolase [Natronobacillus azotifigens]MCZ0703155.1 alpha/beta hydrolase [Natronobacillus azotifigens]
MLNEWITSADGTLIYLYYYDVKNPKAVLQFAHGMGEHAGRYHDFFTFLQSKGIRVVANDHRGHGKTGEKMGVMGFYPGATVRKTPTSKQGESQVV